MLRQLTGASDGGRGGSGVPPRSPASTGTVSEHDLPIAPRSVSVYIREGRRHRRSPETNATRGAAGRARAATPAVLGTAGGRCWSPDRLPGSTATDVDDVRRLPSGSARPVRGSEMRREHSFATILDCGTGGRRRDAPIARHRRLAHPCRHRTTARRLRGVARSSGRRSPPCSVSSARRGVKRGRRSTSWHESSGMAGPGGQRPAEWWTSR